MTNAANTLDPAEMAVAYHYIADAVGELPVIAPDSIVSRTLHSDPHLKVILFGFAKGQELSEHTSARQVLLHFLRGEAVLTLGTETFTAQAGTLVTMEPHLPHSVEALSDTLMLLLQVEHAR